jgi:hypothetical protein
MLKLSPAAELACRIACPEYEPIWPAPGLKRREHCNEQRGYAYAGDRQAGDNDEKP